MFTNGIIVQKNDILPYIDQQSVKEHNYRGIYKGITWPLDAMDDVESVNLSAELFKSWMQTTNNLYTSTSMEVIERYVQHCRHLNINTRCILVESLSDNPHFEHSINTLKTEFLGYEFVASDMQISCSYEDMLDELFQPMLRVLNGNWIFNTLPDIQQHIEFRISLMCEGHEIEEYYSPRIVRLSEFHLQI